MRMSVAARLARSVLKAQQVEDSWCNAYRSVVHGGFSELSSREGAPFEQPSGFVTRDERGVKSELVDDQEWTGKGVEDSCRGSVDERHSRETHVPTRTRVSLELVSWRKCGCGKFRCVDAGFMARRGTRRAALIDGLSCK